VPIPQKILPELTASLKLSNDFIMRTLQRVTQAYFSITNSKRNTVSGKEFTWQWFFPQHSLTFVEKTRELRRYHLHESHVQEALYEAVRRANSRNALPPTPSPQLCNASSSGQLRHPHNPDTSGPQRCKDYDDLHALCSSRTVKEVKARWIFDLPVILKKWEHPLSIFCTPLKSFPRSRLRRRSKYDTLLRPEVLPMNTKKISAL